jgi:acyl carrier protein
MNQQQAVALIKEALAEISPDKAAEFESTSLETRIKDLGIDSVAAMELVGAIEERIGVTFPDEDLAQISRFVDLVDLIQGA